MTAGFRIRCYPTRAQAQTLARWAGCQRFIQNAKVGEDRYFRAFARKSLGLPEPRPPLDQAYSQFIGEDTAWLREVPSPILRNGAVLFRQAYTRFFAGLAGRPSIKRRGERQAVWITSELFTWDIARGDDGKPAHTLHMGTRKFPVGVLKLEGHRLPAVTAAPKSLHVSVEAGRWFVSFSLEDERDNPLPTFAETAEELRAWSAQDLRAVTLGVDRGVVIPAAASDGRMFDFSAVQLERMARKERGAMRQQRRLARQVKGSSNRRKTRARLARKHQYARNVRQDFAHQTSHALVSTPGVRLIIFEDLGVQRMTASPKARQDAQGQYLANGARAKAGLNAAILRSAWGQVQQTTQYKARKQAQLVLAVPAHHTSQECSRCGHTSPENRPTQAVFLCQSCGHSDNADHNAACVIAARGVQVVLSGGYREREKVQARLGRQRAPALRPERSDVMPAEPGVSRVIPRDRTHPAWKQETPTTTAQAA
jgi:putative transposase